MHLRIVLDILKMQALICGDMLQRGLGLGVRPDEMRLIDRFLHPRSEIARRAVDDEFFVLERRL